MVENIAQDKTGTIISVSDSLKENKKKIFPMLRRLCLKSQLSTCACEYDKGYNVGEYLKDS